MSRKSTAMKAMWDFKFKSGSVVIDGKDIQNFHLKTESGKAFHLFLKQKMFFRHDS